MTRSLTAACHAAVATLLVASAPALAADREPGTLSVHATGLEGEEGQVLVSFAFKRPFFGPQAEVAGCNLVAEADTFSTFAQYYDQDPCTQGPISMFAPGKYRVYVGVFEPGATMPYLCSIQNVLVDGDTVVEATEFGSCNGWFM